MVLTKQGQFILSLLIREKGKKLQWREDKINVLQAVKNKQTKGVERKLRVFFWPSSLLIQVF